MNNAGEDNVQSWAGSESAAGSRMGKRERVRFFIKDDNVLTPDLNDTF